MNPVTVVSTTDQCIDQFNKMPTPLIIKILGLLPVQDIISFGKTCKKNRKCSTSDMLWKNISQKIVLLIQEDPCCGAQNKWWSYGGCLKFAIECEKNYFFEISNRLNLSLIEKKMDALVQMWNGIDKEILHGIKSQQPHRCTFEPYCGFPNGTVDIAIHDKASCEDPVCSSKKDYCDEWNDPLVQQVTGEILRSIAQLRPLQHFSLVLANRKSDISILKFD